MKKILATLFIILSTASAEATLLEAKPLRDLIAVVQATDLKYTETGMAFGFNTIKSCVYTSDTMIVLKNYCFPKRNYPAKGYTIISAKFGIIELYHEYLSEELLKRDVRIEVFPEPLAPYVKGSLKNLKLADINKIIETTHKKYGPACWSTNFSFYTEDAEVKCNAIDINGFEDWALETQTLTADQKAWLTLIDQLETQFTE
jgi:hypothetical protein